MKNNYPHSYSLKKLFNVFKILLPAVILFTAAGVSAQVTITVPSVTVTACPGFPTIPYGLGNIVITESAAGDISGSGTMILTAPAHFEFTTSGSASATGTEISGVSTALTNASTITLTFAVGGTAELNAITMSGIYVRGITSAISASGVIRNGGTAVINGDANGAVHASLTSLNAPVLSSNTNVKACSGQLFGYLPLSSTTGASFSWTRSAAPGISNTAASGTGAPNETLTNSTSSPHDVIYVYTVSANGCINPAAFNVTATVNIVPALSSTLSPPAVCSGTVFNYTPQSTTPASTFAWTRGTAAAVSNPAASGTNDPNETLIDLSSSSVNVTYSYRVSDSNCINPNSFDVAVTIKSSPVLTSPLSPPPICSGTTFMYLPTSASPGASFAWTRAAVTGISNTLNSGSGNPNEVLIDTTSSAINVTYSYSVTANGCTNPSHYDVAATVNPSPVMTNANTALICNGSTVNIPLTSNVVSAYSWIAADNSNTTGESLTSQAASTLSNTVTNHSAAAQTVTYTVIPTSTDASCVGAAQTITLTVMPTVTMTNTNSAAICSGTAVNIPLTSSIAAAYTWIAADSIAITGESLTTQTANTLNNTLINTLPVPKAVTYTVTPASLLGNCSGTPQTIAVLVNPKPVMSSAAAASICSGETVNIALTSDVYSSYTWIAADNLNTTGESTLLQTTNTLNNTITNPTASSEAVIYTVIPTFSAGSCTGPSQTVTVTVNPLPVSNAGLDLILCSGTSGGIGAAATAGNTYSWNPATGLSDAAVSDPMNTTVNNGSLPIVTSYTVTTAVTATGCHTSDNAVITVNPQPVLVITNPAAVCFPNTIDLTAAAVTTGSTGGGGFSYWTDAGAVNVLSSPNAVAASGTNYIMVTAAGGCSDIQPVTLVVNPLPVSDAGTDLTLCSGTAGGIGAAAEAGNTYLWNPSTGLSDASVSNPDNTTINNGSTPIVTSYTVTVAITATGCHASDNAVITVNPQPVLTITNPAAVCFPNAIDLTAAAVTAGSTGGGVLTYWTDAGAVNVLSSPSAVTAGETSYIKVTAAGGCTDIKPVTAVVNPLPVSNAGTDLILCSGTAGGIGAAATGGNTYSWSPSTGLSDASVSNPDNTTINNGSTPIVTSYTVTTTITATGCYTSDNAVITVNPQPVLVITNPAAVCFPAAIDLTAAAVTSGSTGGGVLTYWTDAGAANVLSSPNAVTASSTDYIKVTAIGGCTDIKPVIVTINPQPAAVFTSQNESSSLYCDGYSSAHLTGGTGTIQVQWLDSIQTVLSSMDSIGGLCPGTYTLHLSDANSCTNTYTQVIHAGALPPTPPICLVTVDAGNTHNIVVWEKTNLNMAPVDSFIVYREVTTNVYHRIGAVAHDSLSTFDDFGANPNSTGYRYKLKTKNTHFVTSLFSDYHNSIYLTNTGGNFNWTPYQVENTSTPVSSYSVYRDDNSTGNFQFVGSTTGNQFGFTDLNYASFPNSSYYVEASMMGGACNPTRSSFTASRSNVKHNGITTGIDALNSPLTIDIYPNPADNALNIKGISGKTTLRLYDVFGKLVLETETENNTEINTSRLAEGIYMLLTEGKNGRAFNKIVISR